MSLANKLRDYPVFFKRAWRNKACLRSLLSSDNFIFVRDYPPGHFYSPIPDLRQVRALKDRLSPAKALPGVELNESRQLQMVDAFAALDGEMPFPDKQSSSGRYYFDNPFFSYGDGTILYSLFRQLRPRRVIEIGSGFSSAAMLDLNDRFFENQIEFTFIEPYPERLYSLISENDRKRFRIETQPVQAVDLRLFDALRENDILFVDSSHIVKTASDVLHVLSYILPRLQQGVIVHFHDILWPFDYPERWLEEGRAWNEAYFLRAFLQFNAAFEILFFNSFMVHHHHDALRTKLPRMLRSPSSPETEGNSSLWLRRR